MTEGEENIIIKGVLLEAISRDFSEELSNNKEVSVSPRFKRQMMAMMNNPNKWAERHKRDYGIVMSIPAIVTPMLILKR